MSIISHIETHPFLRIIAKYFINVKQIIQLIIKNTTNYRATLILISPN
jgi:hypothetical protein